MNLVNECGSVSIIFLSFYFSIFSTEISLNSTFKETNFLF